MRATRWMQIGCAALLVSVGFAAAAQSMRGYVSRPKRPSPARAIVAPSNPLARTSTPLNCDAYRLHPMPGMVGYCERSEADFLASEAKRVGRPAVSRDVVRLPAAGTTAAKQLGMACIGGTGMRRLANGWEQMTSGSGGWQRCKEG